ncbi:MAG: YXWGXW repeat-containing protein, partial [Planctomycetota bacterium]|nr:YXWGXW repeat-containing protein [Planctomycetota bacterium]
MRMWRMGLIAALLTAVAFGGCKVETRTYVVRENPPPPPGTVYVPAPVPAAPAYLPPPPAPAPAAVAAPMAPAASDVEVMTRGPVHEAFGELIAYGPQAGLVVSRAPPQPVMEIPPDERPADPSIVWIPGYWTWDDDRNDFTWVSGCWRFPPPGCSWMPGYWTQVPAGFQWVAGFWLPSSPQQQAQQVVYLPAPPATVEVGPPGPPPSDTYVWIPGYWAWNGVQYGWQPGYWALAQRDWMWVPAHYMYAPRGCIFVAGYWDHTIMGRGILFAPVYFGHGVYLRAGFRYSPAYAIDSHVLVINLFARPQYSH